MILQFPENQIRELAKRYSYPREEEALLAMRPEVQRAGCLSLDQLKVVALWKAPRAAGHVDKNDPGYVREVSGWAFNARTERGRIEALTLIDGVRWPTASAILHLFHLERYPILDFRALWSIGLDVPDQYTFSFWWSYVEFCRDVADRNSVDMRILDRALWQYSKENQLGDTTVVIDKPSGNKADAIRAFVYEKLVEPALSSGVSEVVVRAGDVHSAMRLHNQMPNVCSALESSKFSERYGLELIRREGPHRGSNVYFSFRSRKLAGAVVSKNAKESEYTPPISKASQSIAISSDPSAVYFVSCVSGKRERPAPAKDLYISDWFLKARRFVESTGRPWFVLSAKYGVVSPDEVIDPYELTLNTMGVAERRRWAENVLRQLQEKAPDLKHIVLLAGMRYREFIEPKLKAMGIEVEVPMEGLRIGEQLSWLEHAR